MLRGSLPFAAGCLALIQPFRTEVQTKAALVGRLLPGFVRVPDCAGRAIGARASVPEIFTGPGACRPSTPITRRWDRR